MSQKRRAGEITEWRHGVGLLWARDMGGGVPFAQRAFFGGTGFCPYKPHVGAFVGEYVSDVFDIAYRDMSDTVRRRQVIALSVVIARCA